MIEKKARETLLSLPGYVTLLGCPGVGKTSLLKSLNVPYRPEPTEDIETLGMQLSKTEWQQVVQDRFYALDSHAGPFWRDSDFYTSLGIFQSPEALLHNLDKYSLILSESLVWLNLPLEQTVRRIIQRGRKSAMMEIENAPTRQFRAAAVFQLHPAKTKVILTPNKNENWKIQTIIRG